MLTSSQPPPRRAISSWREPAGDRRGTWLKLVEQRLMQIWKEEGIDLLFNRVCVRLMAELGAGEVAAALLT